MFVDSCRVVFFFSVFISVISFTGLGYCQQQEPVRDLVADLCLDLEHPGRGISFSHIVHFDIRPGGDIYLLDKKDHRMVHLDRKHTVQNYWGRQGQGPGDLNSPSHFCFQGNEIVVSNAFTAIQVFSDSGAFLRLHKVTPRGQTEALYPLDDGGFITTISKWDREINGMKLTRTLVRFNRDFTQKKDLYRRSALFGDRVNAEDTLPIFFHFCTDRSGVFYIFNRSTSRYEIERYNPDGSLYKKISRPFKAVRKTDLVLKEEERRAKRHMAAVGIIREPRIDPFKRVLHGFQVDEAGKLWVETIGSSATDDRIYLDEFSRDGRFLARYRLPACEAPLIVIRLGAVWMIDSESEDGLLLIRYRLAK